MTVLVYTTKQKVLEVMKGHKLEGCSKETLNEVKNSQLKHKKRTKKNKIYTHIVHQEECKKDNKNNSEITTTTIDTTTTTTTSTETTVTSYSFTPSSSNSRATKNDDYFEKIPHKAIIGKCWRGSDCKSCSGMCILFSLSNPTTPKNITTFAVKDCCSRYIVVLHAEASSYTYMMYMYNKFSTKDTTDQCCCVSSGSTLSVDKNTSQPYSPPPPLFKRPRLFFVQHQKKQSQPTPPPPTPAPIVNEELSIEDKEKIFNNFFD